MLAGRLSTAQVQLGQPSSQLGVEHHVLHDEQVPVAEQVDERHRTVRTGEGVVLHLHHGQPAAGGRHPVIVPGDLLLPGDLLGQGAGSPPSRGRPVRQGGVEGGPVDDRWGGVRLVVLVRGHRSTLPMTSPRVASRRIA